MTLLLTKNLPLLAGAPNGIPKLRELILELAVRGKLIPQDTKDGTASDLLKQIAAEKSRFALEGKIKTPKTLSEITDEEMPFGLPLTWQWTRLGEITNFGSTTKLKNISEESWLLDLEDIEKDTSKLLRRARFRERRSLSDKNSFSVGDVLYGKLRPYLNKVIVADESGFCTTEILPFRCYGPFSPHYFKFVLRSPFFHDFVNSKSYGMKMPRLGTEDGRKALFPLPPLAEQHRIVAKVDELMALCDRLETQQSDAQSAHAQLVEALLDSLTQAPDADYVSANWQRLAAHFDTLFSTEASIDALKQALLQLAVMGKLVPQDTREAPASALIARIVKEKAELAGAAARRLPAAHTASEEILGFKVPQGWAVASISDVALQITDGTHHTPTYLPEGVPFISVKDIDGNSINFDRCKFISIEQHESINARCNPEMGDVLLCRIGTLGRPTLVDTKDPFSLFVSVGLIKLPKQTPISRYVHLLLSSPLLYRQYDQIKAGGSHTNKLNLGDLAKLVLPLPPLAEQQRILTKVGQLMAFCDQLKSRLTQARQLNEQLATTLVERAVA